jgi:hypothetical protein
VENEDQSSSNALGMHFKSLKAAFKVDSSAVTSLNKDFKTLHETLVGVRKELETISKLSVSAKGAIQGQGAQDSSNPHSKMAAMAAKAAGQGAPTPAVGGGAGGGIASAISAAGGGGGGGGAAVAANIIGSLASAIGKAVDSRIQSGYQYSLSADKMNMLYQQTTGMSQLDVQSTYRQPLTDYRLGVGGINEVLALQASTGLSQQASSFDALRTMSGFGYSTADTAAMAKAMASPTAVNRMFFTTGMSMYGIGGKENDMMSVIQNLVQATGMTNETVLKGAKQQGSVTRQRLAFSGLPEDMQDVVIQYAEANLAYKEKGGTGMYNPGDRSQQKLMGISENFALQQEETQRTQAEREENFYRRQADNFADLEKKTQSLTRMFGALEERLSGLLGEQISNKPYMDMAKPAMGAAGTGLLAAGAALTFGTGGAGAIAGIPMMIGGGILSFLAGDPEEKPSNAAANATPNISVPTYGKPTTISGLASMSSFKSLHPTFKNRLLSLIQASGGRVGFGQGKRASSDQRALFLSRYTPTSEDTGIVFEGKNWKKNPGVAPAAPPGRSMHEVGLAADLVGDMGWLEQNASRFGLKTFGDVNNEPWHVQPSELPNSRREYEQMGAAWGSDGKYNEDASFSSEPVGGTTHKSSEHGVGDTSIGGVSLRTYDGVSIDQKIAQFQADSFVSFMTKSGQAREIRSGGSVASANSVPIVPSSGSMSGDDIVRLMMTKGGWSGQDLVKAVGISHRESRWNPKVLNPNKGTGDTSYGLFQINMLGSLGPSRRKWFGIPNDESLYDPSVNVSAARKMFDSRAKTNGNGWYDWGPYKGKPETFNVDMGAAAATVESYKRRNSGDPVEMSGRSGRGGSYTSIQGGSTINIAPTINLIGGSSARGDAEAIADELTRLLKDSDLLASVRGS